MSALPPMWSRNPVPGSLIAASASVRAARMPRSSCATIRRSLPRLKPRSARMPVWSLVSCSTRVVTQRLTTNKRSPLRRSQQVLSGGVATGNRSAPQPYLAGRHCRRINKLGTSSGHRSITIRKCPQESDDIVDLRCAQSSPDGWDVVERRIAIQIGAVGGRQVIEFIDTAIGPARIPTAGIAVTGGIESHGIVQGMDDTIMEEHMSGGHISQARRAEHAAIIRISLEIGS